MFLTGSEQVSERTEKSQLVSDVLKNKFGEINKYVGEQKTMFCDLHGERVATVIASFGEKRIYSSCSPCVELKKQEKLHEKARQRQAIVQEKLNAAGIPKFYAQKTFDAFDDSLNSEKKMQKRRFRHSRNLFTKILAVFWLATVQREREKRTLPFLSRIA